jgi:hypothetical protein
MGEAMMKRSAYQTLGALAIGLAIAGVAAQEQLEEQPSSAVEIFEHTGKNPGSSAFEGSPGRVRQDAPAQHELGLERLLTPELIERIKPLQPQDPEPFPEFDPRFDNAIRLSDDSRSDDFPAIASNPANREDVWMAWVSYSGRRDRIQLAHRNPTSGQWGVSNPVPGVTGDVWRPCLVFDAKGRLWVIWAQQDLFEADFDLYGRSFADGRWGHLERLAAGPGGDLDQAVARGPDGTLHLVWQSFRTGTSDILYTTFNGEGWSAPIRVSPSDGNDWAPAVAVDSNGTAWVAWDSYDRGSYDVLLRPITAGIPGEITEVAASPRFEARPTVAVDGANRVWVAYEAGEEGWGKDQGRMIPRDPQPGVELLRERRVQVRVMEGDTMAAAKPELPLVFPHTDTVDTYGFPKHPPMLGHPLLVADEEGRISLVVRRAHIRQWAEYWRVYVLTMTAEGWSAPAMCPYSEGARVAVYHSAAATSGGGLWIAWARDNVPTISLVHTIPEETVIENVYCARYEPAPAEAGERLGPPEEPPFEQRPIGHPREAEDVARIRASRVEIGGQRYRIVRGDAHRHTEFSMDVRGITDGSVLDFYRYMLDAAAMDWGLVTDHQYGSEHEYWWWLTEKLADLFHHPPGYTALFGYERSIAWPDGHRNILHATRGHEAVPFFLKPTLAYRPKTSTRDAQPNDTRLLYEAIRSSGGIAISHTSATGMGTDWRDNDPALEPVVELAQGDRGNYEHLGAPLADPTVPEAARSRFEQGFVSKAWEKGLRLGVILSSDHKSTHISYAMAWVEEPSREAVMEALRARRTYGATDNIILEFWIGDHFMGSEFAREEVPPIRLKVVGTDTISDVQVIRNNRSIYNNPGGSSELELSFRDVAPEPGTNVYYLRVLQADRQAAWSSPIWVRLPERP